VPQLLPFPALRYHVPAGDLSALVCPPYDVIAPAERARLAALDPRNAVHLELPDSYRAAADALRAWLADGSLVRDGAPAIYPYEQRFATEDGEGVARGFFCLLRLEPYGPASGVRPHEATLGPAKEDRFRLLEAVRMHVSPVLLVYESVDGGVASGELLATLTSGAPPGWAVDGQGDRQALGLADGESATARALLNLAGHGPLTIADGHHRYETALRYAHQAGAPAEARYVLALLYDAHSGGLQLRPWHRLVQGIDAGRLAEQLPRFFDVERHAQPRSLMTALRGAGQGTLGFWTRAGGALLEVRRSAVAPLLEGAGSQTLRWLDVSVLSVTLSAMMGSSGEGPPEATLAYTSDARQAIDAVESGAADACFLLTPTPIDAVMAVAAAGEHMPPKSTYFQPKAATGLVLHPLFA
jgi:uncharacterized protein (DUF1015 family)